MSSTITNNNGPRLSSTTTSNTTTTTVPPSPIPHLRIASHQLEEDTQSFVTFTVESSILAANSTIEKSSLVVSRRRRYRDFEKLRENLKRNGFATLNLPGKLFIHSESAISQRRKDLERSLIDYVAEHGTNPILDEFLGITLTANNNNNNLSPFPPPITPIRPTMIGHHHNNTRTTNNTTSDTLDGGMSSMISGTETSKSSNNNNKLILRNDSRESGGDDDDNTDNDDDDVDSNTSSTRQEEHLRFYMPYPLELLAARAAARSEAQASKRLSLIFACLSVATSLLAILSKRRANNFTKSFPLEGMTFGFAASSLITYMFHSIPARRQVRHLVGMFGFDVPPTSCTIVEDVASLVQNFKYNPTTTSLSPPSTTTSSTTNNNNIINTPKILKQKGSSNNNISAILPPTTEFNATSTTLVLPAQTPAAPTKSISSSSSSNIDDLAMLDAFNNERRHFEGVTQARLLYQQNRTEVEIMWRLSRALYYAREVDGFDPKAVIGEALQVIQQALTLAPDHPQVLKFIALLRNAESQIPPNGTGQRIEAALAFEQYVSKALKIDPQDPTLWYMMGRFNFDLANLSWMERRGAKAIYGQEPPAGSYVEALRCFEKSHELKPTAATFLKVGESLLKLRKDKGRADQCIKLASTWTPPSGTIISSEDERSVVEAKKLLGG
jgi:hypothetical protein